MTYTVLLITLHGTRSPFKNICTKKSVKLLAVTANWATMMSPIITSKFLTTMRMNMMSTGYW
jgi:hypothetical protein